MFQELIELFKRFVLAHEKIAEANAVIAQATATQFTDREVQPFVPTVDDHAKDRAEVYGCAPTSTGHTPPPAAAEWDPYTSPVMKQYKGDKGDILRRELAKFGLDVGTKMTGAQMHELLLEKASAVADTPAPSPVAVEPPQAVLPGVPVVPVAPAVPVAPSIQSPTSTITLDNIREIISVLCMKGDAARNEALRLLNEVGGVSRLTDAATGQQLLADDKFMPLYNALHEANGRM